jgi:O-antigen ligase/tetratricopeptide (TPR) repeat protein
VPVEAGPSFRPAAVARWLLALHLLACPLVFTTATPEVFEANKAALLTCTAVLLAALGLARFRWVVRLHKPEAPARGTQAPSASAGTLARRASEGESFPRWRVGLTLWGRADLLTLGFLLLIASAAISTLTSLSPRTSWRGCEDSHAGLRTLLGYLVLFLATRAVCPDMAAGRRVLLGAVLAAAAAAGYGILQAAGLDPITWDNVSAFAGHGRVFGPLGHAILLGAYLAMVLPLVAAYAADAARHRRRKALAGLALAGCLMLVVVLLTLSRAAWLASAVSLILLAVLWGRTRGIQRLFPEGGVGVGVPALAGLLQPRPAKAGTPTTHRMRTWLAAVAVVAGLAVVVLAWPGQAGGRFHTSLVERVRHLSDGSGRPFVWRACWDLFRDRPGLGWGPDTLRFAFGRHRPVGYADIEWNAAPVRGHNIVLHVLATQGAAGGVALLVLLAGLGVAARRAWRRAAPEDRPIVAAVAAGLTAFIVTGLFGFTVTACGSLFAVCAGLLSAWARPAAPGGAPRVGRFPRTRMAWSILVAVAAVAVVWAEVVRPLAAAVACRDGDLLLGTDHEAARRHYQRAAAWDPGHDRYPDRLAGMATARAAQTRSADEAAAELARALACMERAIALVGADPYHHANRARILADQVRQGRAAAATAFAAWDTALSLDPDNAWFLAEAARTALLLGDGERLRFHASRALELYPHFAPPYAHLGAEFLRQGRFAEAVEWLNRGLQADWHGDTDAAVHAGATLAAAYLELGSFAQAHHYAQQVLVFQPRWATAHFLLAQALEGEGQFRDAAVEYRQTLALSPRHTPAQAALRRLAGRAHP